MDGLGSTLLPVIAIPLGLVAIVVYGWFRYQKERAE